MLHVTPSKLLFSSELLQQKKTKQKHLLSNFIFDQKKSIYLKITHQSNSFHHKFGSEQNNNTAVEKHESIIKIK